MGKYVFKSGVSKEDIRLFLSDRRNHRLWDTITEFLKKWKYLLEEDNYQKLFELWMANTEYSSILLAYFLYYCDIDFMSNISDLSKAGLPELYEFSSKNDIFDDDDVDAKL